MRKVVCSCCAQDWTIQHYCKMRDFGVAVPTVIWEPDPPKEKGQAWLRPDGTLMFLTEAHGQVNVYGCARMPHLDVK